MNIDRAFSRAVRLKSPVKLQNVTPQNVEAAMKSMGADAPRTRRGLDHQATLIGDRGNTQSL